MRDRRLMPAVLVAALSLWLAGCRTTSETEGSEAKVAGGNAGSLAAQLDLPKEDDQSLYLAMLGVELNAGVKVAKDQLHTARGVFQCTRSGELESCVLRVRLMERELSATQPVQAELAGRVWAFIKSSRQEIAAEKNVLTDVTCDYIGKKSPPYNVEDVGCVVTFARTADEAVFVDQHAEELAEALRGEASFGNQPLALSGSLVCTWVDGAPRTPCLVRAIVGGVLQERIREVSPRNAAPIAKRMMQAVLDEARVAQDPKEPRPVVAPSEIMGALTCLVDNLKYETEGQRRYLCRAKL